MSNIFKKWVINFSINSVQKSFQTQKAKPKLSIPQLPAPSLSPPSVSSLSSLCLRPRYFRCTKFLGYKFQVYSAEETKTHSHAPEGKKKTWGKGRERDLALYFTISPGWPSRRRTIPMSFPRRFCSPIMKNPWKITGMAAEGGGDVVSGSPVLVLASPSRSGSRLLQRRRVNCSGIGGIVESDRFHRFHAIPDRSHYKTRFCSIQDRFDSTIPDRDFANNGEELPARNIK